MTWTQEKMPSLDGRVAIVTGATSGVGYALTRLLMGRGAHVVIGARDLQKGAQIAQRLLEEHRNATVTPLELDLASLASVERFASEFESTSDRLDFLINNAGIGDNDVNLTQDGFPQIMGVNHLGHFALTGALIDKLLATPKSRIVTMTSQVYRNSSISLECLTKPSVNSYGASKLANLLFALELQRRLSGTGSATLSLAAHPGGSRTEGVESILEQSTNPVFKLFFGLFVRRVMQSADAGAQNPLRAATDPDAKGGELYGPSGFLSIRGYPVVQLPKLKAADTNLAMDLWEQSIALTGATYETLCDANLEGASTAVRE